MNNTLSNEEGARILGEPPILNAYRLQRSEHKRNRYPSLFVAAGFVVHDAAKASDADVDVPQLRGEAEREKRNIGMCIRVYVLLPRDIY